MPPHTDLQARIAADRGWQQIYDRQLPAAQALGREVPLVHVSRWAVWLFAEAPHEVPRSDHPIPDRWVPSERQGWVRPITYCSRLTQGIEDTLGFPRSAYFYAGRGHPRYGDVAFAFPPACESGRTGAAYPFDTGSLVNPTGPIPCRFPLTAVPSRVQLVQGAEVLLPQWRARFAEVLAAYFDPLSNYWDGRPARLDPEDVFDNPAESWVAWTFEVRLEEPVGAEECEAWSASKACLERLRRLAEESGATPLMRQLLTGGTFQADDGADDYCEVIERWLRNRLGI